MKFDSALEALAAVTWDWSEAGFERLVVGLGLAREPDADPEMPSYISPWGKEWVQAIVEDGAVERVELLVEDTAPRWRPFSSKKVEALAKKYRTKLAAYVNRAEDVLGTPAFTGDRDASGFPEDEDGFALAMWRRDSARLIVMARNEGPDTPFWISIVIKPARAARAATARPSKPVLRAPTRQSSMVISVAAVARFDYALKTIHGTKWTWTPEMRDTVLAQLAPATYDSAAQRIELVIDSSTAKTESEHEELDREYGQKFDSYIDRARKVLGKPKFCNGATARGFPDDERTKHGHEKVQLLALWRLKKARLMVVYSNDGPEAPCAISVVVKP